MRATQFYLATLKEAPQEAELASHKLMLRAGLIRRLASGLYTWMPLGLRVLRRVEKVVREEMNRAGALEILAPPVQPAELWQAHRAEHQPEAMAALEAVRAQDRVDAEPRTSQPGAIARRQLQPAADELLDADRDVQEAGDETRERLGRSLVLRQQPDAEQRKSVGQGMAVVEGRRC